MKEKDRIILQKIEKYISEVASYTQGMRFDQFMDDA
jgi:uncharacterized protein with HEPN domain